MENISFELKSDSLKLTFKIDGREVSLDVIGTEDNPIVIKFSNTPGYDLVEVDQVFNRVIGHMARPDKDRVEISIGAARTGKLVDSPLCFTNVPKGEVISVIKEGLRQVNNYEVSISDETFDYLTELCEKEE